MSTTRPSDAGFAASPAVLAELAAGLQADLPGIAPKFFYDELGSKLFEAICELPEYYPTRTEAGIFAEHGAAMGRSIGAGSTLIDLGAGNCAKAAALFPVLHPAQYVPVDISFDFLREALGRLQQRFPHIEMTGIGLDFSRTLGLPETVRRAQRLFFYPGSSIGNFTPEEACDFLRRVRAQCDDDGGVLLGVDLVKNTHILDAAYDDALGVTAAFNLNLLRHLNRLIGADFDVRQWRHVAFFNEHESRIEMHLEARAELTVHWAGGRRSFRSGERIHTENSYKYRSADAAALLGRAGFQVMGQWQDAKGWFAVFHARAAAA
ncbi:MAG: L-histidine N(alpha)-methyltransferase [Pseudomonadota bacterium]